MIDASLVIAENVLVSRIGSNGQFMAWFLGAGTSRGSGLPTATDIILDLKRQHYCSVENQQISDHDLSNKAVQARIQAFCESKGFPASFSKEEYSFYFDLIFGSNDGEQQKYLERALSPSRLSLNTGPRALAGLLATGQSRVVFTTNFDPVLEEAFAVVAGKSLSAFHIEGSYAALDALNADRFPLYVKLHGDFRYRSTKNLSADLLANDEKLQSCFIAASSRFGFVVSGFSGRDANVMAMFQQAVSQTNAFPQGLFWTVPNLNEITPEAIAIISEAKAKGINASICEIGTFDNFLLKVWRQQTSKPTEIDAKIVTAGVQPVSIAVPKPGKKFPLIRTNGLAITQLPQKCGQASGIGAIPFRELRDSLRQANSNVVATLTDRLLFWGDPSEIKKAFPSKNVTTSEFSFPDTLEAINDANFLQAFLEEAIATGLAKEKPVFIRKRGRTFFAVSGRKPEDAQLLRPLQEAIGSATHGSVPKLADTYWSEAVSIKVERRAGGLWLMLQPDIWINPLSSREKAVDFMRERRRRRFNGQSYQILDAWIKILLGSVGAGEEIQVSAYDQSPYPMRVRITTRTSFSGAQ